MELFRPILIGILVLVACWVLWHALVKPWLTREDEIDEMEELRRGD